MEVELINLLHIDHLRVNVSVGDKADLLDTLVGIVKDDALMVDAEEVRSAVKAREEVMSTGVGKGLALPHAKTNAVSGSIAALVTLEQPIEYGALDDEPVQIAFLLLGTSDAKSQHVRILSRISRLMNNDATRQRIIDAGTPEELLSAIVEQGQSSNLR